MARCINFKSGLINTDFSLNTKVKKKKTEHGLNVSGYFRFYFGSKSTGFEMEAGAAVLNE